MATFDDVRRIALGLPEGEERVTWDVDITFRVRDKIFAMGGPGGDRASIKASPDRQAGLVDLDPETFAPSAYVGRYGWVTVDLAASTSRSRGPHPRRLAPDRAEGARRGKASRELPSKTSTVSEGDSPARSPPPIT